MCRNSFAVWYRQPILFFVMFLLGTLGMMSYTTAAQAANDQSSSVNLVTAVEKVAKDNIPAVVHIEVVERQEVANPLFPFQQSPFFRYFFNFPRRMPREFHRELYGLGSGIIMDAQGHILTNNHVVAGATKIKVVLADGRVFAGKSVKLLGTDPKTDLAVLKIDSSTPLPHVTFGNSDKVKVGQWVVAIGQPEGLSETVTQGVISAKHRRGITDPSSYQDFLQTDAPINPGNSGGPLLTLNGKVIGVNSAIFTKSGMYAGIGFAIPSNMALNVARQLIAHGKVTRGWIGVVIQRLTPSLAKSFGLTTTKGVLVADVLKGGPASKAGLKRGDVIVEFDGKQVTGPGQLRNLVAETQVGKEVKMTVIRNGKEEPFTIKIGNQEEEAKMLQASIQRRLGVKVGPMTGEEMNRYGLKEEEGVVIKSVSPNGVLGKAGFQVGDVILEIDGQAIKSPAGLADVLRALPANQKANFLVLDHRTGQTGYVQVQIPG